MIDKEHASFESVYEGIKSSLTPRVIPVEVPIGEGADFHGILNLFDKKAHLFKKGTKLGEYDEVDVPDDQKALFDRYYEQLIETIAATDDVLLERYLGGEEIARADALNAMKEAMKRQELFPLFCCSSELTYGTQALLTKIVELMPTAFEMEELHAFVGAEGDKTVEIHAVDSAPFTALVFKTHAEPHVGDVSYFRTFSGRLMNGQEVYNATRDVAEKMAHITIPQGKERVEVPLLHPGDIGCVAKLKNTHTNDTLSTREHPVRLPGIEFPEPRVVYAVHATARGDEEKLQQGLHRLHDEDTSFQTHYNPETHETIVAGLGERHLDVVMARLKRQYGVEAELKRPEIAYRETFAAKAQGQGRHKKQSGGHGQFGDCWIRMGPTHRGCRLPVRERRRRRIDSVEIHSRRGQGNPGSVGARNSCRLSDGGFSGGGVRRELSLGGLQRDELQDGRHSGIQDRRPEVPADSSRAARRARDHDARPIPRRRPRRSFIAAWTHPRHRLGSRRDSKVRAVVPQAELHLYATDLYSKTHGHGSFVQRFKGYEQMPGEAAQRVINESKGSKMAVGE